MPAHAALRLLGLALRRIRPGLDATVSHREPAVALPCTIALSSPAFANGQSLPARLTQDGRGDSPALAWSRAAGDVAGYALLVEDADAPLPWPIVHAIVVNIPPTVHQLAEGSLPHFRDRARPVDASLQLGRNVYGGATWLPPAPIPGHGPHRYVFQVFAFARAPGLGRRCTRADLVRAIARCACARGELVGVYERA